VEGAQTSRPQGEGAQPLSQQGEGAEMSSQHGEGAQPSSQAGEETDETSSWRTAVAQDRAFEIPLTAARFGGLESRCPSSGGAAGQSRSDSKCGAVYEDMHQRGCDLLSTSHVLNYVCKSLRADSLQLRGRLCRHAPMQVRPFVHPSYVAMCLCPTSLVLGVR
jgi:hypothetical protein